MYVLRCFFLLICSSLVLFSGKLIADDAALDLARTLEVSALLDPRGVLDVIEAMDADGARDLSPRARERLAIAHALALEGVGRAAAAEATLARHSTERPALVRAELARRRGDGDGLRAALAAGAPSSDLAAALLQRDGAEPGSARGEASP